LQNVFFFVTVLVCRDRRMGDQDEVVELTEAGEAAKDKKESPPKHG
jgi:hypothetical protein